MSHRDIATDYASEALAQRNRTAALGYQIVACDLGNMGWFALVRDPRTGNERSATRCGSEAEAIEHATDALREVQG